MSGLIQKENRVFEILSDLSKEMSFIPVDVEYVKAEGDDQLLIYVDKEGGITIDDCENISRAIDPVIDDENIFDSAYTMIVSSPGLCREIRRPRDFDFALGKEIDIKLYAKVDGSKEYTGILKSFSDEDITVDIENNEKVFAKKEIAKINLTVYF